MIKPTIGRVVLVHRFFADGLPIACQPEPALICWVHDDRMINVGGFSGFGGSFAVANLPLLQDDDLVPPGSDYAEWMPYQKQVASEQSAKVSLAALGIGNDGSPA